MARVAATNATRDLLATFIPAWRTNASYAKLWIGEGGTSCGNTKVINIYANVFNEFNILREGGLAGVDVFCKQSLSDLFGKCFAVPKASRP
jgi:hypothetical protein|tara:strand:+ start:188 stop:460 length:273 start_codon:yes stop_codon:yes gene_type:complete